jgi:hypothetical protein
MMFEEYYEIQESYDSYDLARKAKKFWDTKDFECCHNDKCIGNHKVAARRGLAKKHGQKNKLAK